MPKLKVDRELLQRVAKNARLELSETEINAFLPQLQEILSAFKKIEEVDIKGTKPAFHPIPLSNKWREDKIEKCLENEQALENAVHKKSPYFKGPKAIE
ncbi:Asp-tRNA(Asn)/Glu-tRNA(Gln) amidotransferase subunit GatC [Candidatus Micrarchaeota archaeon]|nr:Asp-tRNA(Asn)/Glu-tRNA(Gln) amidotransferase subunit GatC [Candidatus Micrarchaeota archaeon]MBU1930677.1 Asp-tRNA(Asn)/Glu-tRNA(Gln) amidotransferase subunit GatC [Candidatus Micrarchaeota archaeon]